MLVEFWALAAEWLVGESQWNVRHCAARDVSEVLLEEFDATANASGVKEIDKVHLLTHRYPRAKLGVFEVRIANA